MNTVVYIENDPLWAEVVEKLVRETRALEFLGFAGSLEAAAKLCNQVNPDVILLDVFMPDGSGIDFARELSRSHSRSRVIFLTVAHSEALLHSISLKNVRGVVTKELSVLNTLPHAIETVIQGFKYFTPLVLEVLTRWRLDPIAFFKILSEREIELLPHFGRGGSDDEIAAELSLSWRTVKSHRQHIMAKLGLHSSGKLMHWAITRGFVPFNAPQWGEKLTFDLADSAPRDDQRGL